MALMLRRRWAFTSILIVLLVFASGTRTSGTSSPDPLSPSAAAQIQALLEEKETRTPAQQKVDPNLLYEAKQRRGQPVAPGVPMLETGIEVGPAGEVVVDIVATVTGPLLDALASLGGKVLESLPEYRSLRAELPLDAVETLAESPEVLFINHRQKVLLNRAEPAAPATRGVSAPLLSSVRPGFAARAAQVRSQLAAVLEKGTAGAKPAEINKLNTSQGVVTHRADLAMSTFGTTGAGVKVGVLSDGVNSLGALQASGDLPAVTVLPNQEGTGNEGCAMLEIVYDMAPGAQLYYATGFYSVASFANNIRALRTAGCDIIIDDVTWSSESPFQKGQTAAVASTTNGGLITQAVNDVTASGALYFSSAGNSGGKNKNTSGTWEGDYVDGGPAGPPVFSGRLHNFGGFNYDTVTAAGVHTILFWSDPLGGSGNDYDVFQLDSTGTNLIAASTRFQGGTHDPYELIDVATQVGDRIVILNCYGEASPRFFHLENKRGRLSINTQGSTRGHNAPPGPNAFGVAATPAVFPGPFPDPFNFANHVETFSSDGPRHFFFNADSSPITPGNFLSGGGQIVQQPLITAADGVSCAAPGFSSFYGTSAAAPHAGAIAALVKSARPSLTASQISSVLTSATIDIEAYSVDRDSGYGILDAFAAVQAVAVTPTNTPTPTRTRTPTPTSTPFVVQGVKGDFNGDGKTDILWRHTSGANYVFFMNGITVMSGASLVSVDPSWSVVGTADFNGDGKTDILWRHTSGANYVFFMNGTTVTSGASLPSADPSWSIGATGDFNSDGKPDILLRHTSGAVYVWLMNGTTVVSGASLVSVDPSWRIAATGDFNGDTKTDILWHHTSGAAYVFFMNGTVVASGANLPSADPSWTIAAAGDFNADGKPDIVWRHTSGAVYVWLMNGTAVASGASLPSADPSWKIVGPK